MKITQAAPHDATVVGDIWAAALRDDRMAGAGLRDRDAIGQMFHILASGYTAEGMVWIVDERGAASWIPPGSTEAIHRVDAATRARLDELSDDPVAHERFWDWIWSHLPDEPMWFLDVLAVHPDHQGLGIGRELLRFGLDQARDVGLPAMLDTSNERNVSYYESFGFVVMADKDAPDDGPHVWFMRAD